MVLAPSTNSAAYLSRAPCKAGHCTLVNLLHGELPEKENCPAEPLDNAQHPQERQDAPSCRWRWETLCVGILLSSVHITIDFDITSCTIWCIGHILQGMACRVHSAAVAMARSV